MGYSFDQPDEVSVLFLGDTSFGENYQEKLDENILVTKGYAHSLERFESILLASDLNIANLETPLTNLEASPLEGQKRYLHWSDVEHAPNAFQKYNMAVFSLANNHSMDYGVEGLGQTLRVLGDRNMTSFGAGLTAEEARQPFVHTFTVGHRTATLAVIASFEFRPSYEERYSFYPKSTEGMTMQQRNGR